ncbi:MAG TPA: hypothetical protein VGC18_14805 [Lacisediminihabitans sp.]|uniref:hypothetical protein n=1 Tax=Lacisediminihabitans sp. TaxID=2787631 RepID=UPI002ED7CB7B
MPEAPRQRPADHLVLASFSGHVRARPKAVFEAIDQRLRPSEGSRSSYFADDAAFLIVEQGGWWYRGEYRIVPDERGSNVEHYILNVARRMSGLGGAAARRVLRLAPVEFDRLIAGLRRELE